MPSPLMRVSRTAALVLLMALVCGAQAPSGDGVPAPISDPGESMTLGARPPRTARPATVLFHGVDMRAWRHRDGEPCGWLVQPDGAAVATVGDAVTRETFGDLQLHLEFLCPLMTGKQGQARANSGVYIHGRYEVQVLDTFGLAPALNGCGAVYNIAAPITNAARPAGQWQTYDIFFRAPRLDAAGTVTERPRITVLHNGIIVHNNMELPGTTPGGLDERMEATGPLLLQFHGDPVRYRNIWVRSLPAS